MYNKKKCYMTAGIICLAVIAVAVVILAVAFGRQIGPLGRIRIMTHKK